MKLEDVQTELAQYPLSEEAKKVISACLKIGYALVKEREGGPFICGESKELDGGLPKLIWVCPQYGADGSAPYTKSGDYTAPGW
jgi:hypothetical protein